jgi:hypothetical protein
MTVTAYELNTSRKYINNEGKPRAEREYVVVGAVDEAQIITLFDGSTLPTEGELYPASVVLPYDMEFFDFAITKEPNSNDIWRVVCRYKPQIDAVPSFQNPTSTNLQPNEVGYRTCRMNMTSMFYDAWREFSNYQEELATILTVTSFGSLNAAQKITDIGGYSIDVSTIPTSTQKWQQEFSILVTDRFLPDSFRISTQVGSRNSDVFMNYAKGSVVFTGCSVENIPDVGRNSIEYKFIYDSSYHLIQFPARADNKGVPKKQVTAGGIVAGCAENVYFRQPFAYTSNFNNLSEYFYGL